MSYLARMEIGYPSYRIAAACAAYFALICATFMGSARLEAGCPPAIFADVAGLVFPETKKSDLLVVSRAKSGWAKVPHDVIPLRFPSRPHRWQQTLGRNGLQPLSSGRFMVDFRDQWWTRSVVSNQDILIAPDFSGAGRATGRDLRAYAATLGCPSGRFWEVEQTGFMAGGGSATKFLYLMKCPGRAAAAEPSMVHFDSKGLSVRSPSFRYQMNRSNQMLFDRLEAAGASGPMELFLEDGNFDIRADFKNFFNMHFTADNVGSKVVAERNGAAASVARLSFDLKMLFLKLDLQLNTDLLFFHDAVFLPMIMKIPRDAWKYVHPGSGVLYSWFSADKTMLQESWTEMPRRRLFKTKGDVRLEAMQVAPRYCMADGNCRFRAAVGRGAENKIVVMEVVIARNMVESGFFPQYVADARPEVRELGWDWGAGGDDAKSRRRREGLYFELSGLGKGDHGFEIWVRLMSPDVSPAMASICPAETRVREVTALN